MHETFLQFIHGDDDPRLSIRHRDLVEVLVFDLGFLEMAACGLVERVFEVGERFGCTCCESTHCVAEEYGWVVL